MSRFSYVEITLHYYLADFPVAYQITAVTFMVMGNLVILLKSQKFEACEMFYSILNLTGAILAKCKAKNKQPGAGFSLVSIYLTGNVR